MPATNATAPFGTWSGECAIAAGGIGGADRLAAAAAIEEIDRTFGRIDILVNNAGGAITPFGTSFESKSTDAALAYIFGVHFYHMIYRRQAALPALKRQGGT